VGGRAAVEESRSALQNRIGSPQLFVLLLEFRNALLVGCRDTADDPVINIGLANPGLQTFRPVSELIGDPLHGPA